jgi:hypothetical protein
MVRPLRSGGDVFTAEWNFAADGAAEEVTVSVQQSLVFWSSCTKLEEFRLNPYGGPSTWVKFHPSIWVKTLNGIDASQHPLEEFSRAQLVFDAWRKFYRRNYHNSYLSPIRNFRLPMVAMPRKGLPHFAA